MGTRRDTNRAPDLRFPVIPLLGDRYREVSSPTRCKWENGDEEIFSILVLRRYTLNVHVIVKYKNYREITRYKNMFILMCT
jgi:hypothetical protein